MYDLIVDGDSTGRFDSISAVTASPTVLLSGLVIFSLYARAAASASAFVAAVNDFRVRLPFSSFLAISALQFPEGSFLAFILFPRVNVYVYVIVL